MLLSNKDPFGSGKWQDFLNQIAFLNENNIRIESVKSRIEEHKKKAEQETREVEKFYATIFKCPECGFRLQILPLNNSPATQTGDNSKSVRLCSKCFYEQFSEKTVDEQIKEIRMKDKGRRILAP